jgi:hypothetical protein
MKLPRLILNPAVRLWIQRWQQERREVIRLRRERLELLNRLLEQSHLRPLFQPPAPPTQPQPQPPIGATAKRAYLASQRTGNEPLTAEDVAAKRANGNH